MLRRFNKEEFDEVFALLEKSFPKEEYRDYQGQLQLLDDPQYSIYIEKTDTIDCLFCIWEFDKYFYIENFCVNPDKRNNGLGSQLLQELINNTNKRVILEVEVKDSSEMANRRIGFYTRNGLYLNDYPYMQPSLGVGRKAIPLSIMSTRSTITKEEFDEVKYLLYKYVYKQAV